MSVLCCGQSHYNLPRQTAHTTQVKRCRLPGTFFGWSVIFHARIQSIEPKQVTIPYRVFQEELICFENE
ncbi:hypothetical protein DsansV1_C16g0140921 [Dioscorea sansibarensis]